MIEPTAGKDRDEPREAAGAAESTAAAGTTDAAESTAAAGTTDAAGRGGGGPRPGGGGTERRRTGRWRTGEDSRRRILEAARACFTERGYERTTVRQIAAAAGVDPAMVHYFFGSKSGLLAAAIDFPVDPATRIVEALGHGVEGVGRRLVMHFLTVWDDAGSFDPILALIRSSPDPESGAGLLREFVTREILARIGEAIPGPDARLRAEVAGSHLIGLALARYVVRLEPLASTPRERLADLVGPVLQSYLDGSGAPGRSG